MGSDAGGINNRNEYAQIRYPRSVTSVAADNSTNRGSHLLSVFQRAHQVGAYVVFCIAAADGKNEDHIFFAQAGAAEPVRITGVPAFVVHACGEFGDIIGGGVGLDLGDFAEIADCMRGMTSSSSHTEKKEPSRALAELEKQVRRAFNCRLIEETQDLRGFLKILSCIAMLFASSC